MSESLAPVEDLQSAVTAAEKDLSGLRELVRWRRIIASAALTITTVVPLTVAFSGGPWPHTWIAAAIVLGYLALAGGIAVSQLDYVVERQRESVRNAAGRVNDQIERADQLLVV